MDNNKVVNDLIDFSILHLGRKEIDKPYLYNLLKAKFNNTKIDDTSYVLGLLTPPPSSIAENFWKLRNTPSPFSSFEYLYNLHIKNNYIKNEDSNIKWTYTQNNKNLIVTINVSKQEKGGSKTKVNNDSFCPLCIENMGRVNKTNLRIIPLCLNGESWFMQFSPHNYFDYHLVVVNGIHKPMKINKNTFKCLVDFVDQFNEFFIGSNTDLPIVGGSILEHNHFQAGINHMPIMDALPRFSYEHDDFKICYLDWFNSCYRIETKTKDILIDIMNKILLKWQSYNNPEINICSKSKDGNHNTLNPLIKKDGDTYYGYCILRNNCCSNKYKHGIFNTHEQYHNIKREGIGLFEEMGYFILPRRLKDECQKIKTIMTSSLLDLNDFYLHNKDMLIHQYFIDSLINKYGFQLTSEKVENILNKEIAKICQKILINTAVFKNTAYGNKAAKDFLDSINEQ